MSRDSITFVIIIFLCCLLHMSHGLEEHMKYKDPKQNINVRIKDLMKRMTLAEKIGQMVQLDRIAVTPDKLREYGIGSLLSGGGSVPLPKSTPEDWIDMINGYQNSSLSSRLGIPMIYGIDAVHGHNNVYQATIFPHNVGLGATRQNFLPISFIHFSYNVFFHLIIDDDYDDKCRDPELVKKIGAATALEVRATGINYAFSPCIDVCKPQTCYYIF